MELFIRHLIHDILIKKTVDKVLKLVRKLHWEDPKVRRRPFRGRLSSQFILIT